MKHTLIAVILFFSMACNMAIAAQEGLSEQERNILSQRVTQKVEEFTHSLSRMVDDTQSRDVRTSHQKNILGLTMGKGDPYDIIEDGRVKHSTGVKMKTSSVNRTTITTQLLKTYLRRLYDPSIGKSQMPYKKIQIETADFVKVDNIEQEGDHYVCNAVFYQKFYGTRRDGSQYIDWTAKSIKCYITPIKLPDGNGYDVKLADISVLKTERI